MQEEIIKEKVKYSVIDKISIAIGIIAIIAPFLFPKSFYYEGGTNTSVKTTLENIVATVRFSGIIIASISSIGILVNIVVNICIGKRKNRKNAGLTLNIILFILGLIIVFLSTKIGIPPSIGV